MHLIFNSLIGTRRNRLRINLGFPATRTNATKQTAWSSQVTIESATSQSPTSMNADRYFTLLRGFCAYTRFPQQERFNSTIIRLFPRRPAFTTPACRQKFTYTPRRHFVASQKKRSIYKRYSTRESQSATPLKLRQHPPTALRAFPPPLSSGRLRRARVAAPQLQSAKT